MNEEMIPIMAFISMAIVFVFWFYFKHRSKMETQQTFRMALEKGSELSPEFIKHLGEPERPKDQDLRRGLIWCGIAVGFALLGLAIPDEDATQVMAGVAATPFLIGCAYLLMYRFGNK